MVLYPRKTYLYTILYNYKITSTFFIIIASLSYLILPSISLDVKCEQIETPVLKQTCYEALIEFAAKSDPKNHTDTCYSIKDDYYRDICYYSVALVYANNSFADAALISCGKIGDFQRISECLSETAKLIEDRVGFESAISMCTTSSNFNCFYSVINLFVARNILYILVIIVFITISSIILINRTTKNKKDVQVIVNENISYQKIEDDIFEEEFFSDDKTPKKTTHEYDSLQKYISQCRKLGYSDEQIKKKLEASGYEEDIIRLAMEQ